MMPVMQPTLSTHHIGDPSPPPGALLTTQDLITLYETTHLPSLASPAPIRCRLRKYFDPLRALSIAALTVPVVQTWVNTIRQHSTSQSNACLTLLRSMINLAIRCQLWPSQINPAAYVKRKKLAARTRYVLEAEVPGLITELEREPVFIRLYFYLEIFCGPRPSEVERMRRQHVRLLSDGTAFWFKPETKTTEHRIRLPFCLPDLLTRHLAVLSPATDWLFPSRHDRPLSHEFWHARWEEIRDRCRLHDVQMRDLRRTCSTRLLNDADTPMDLISLSKGVLNHTNLNTTQIYARPTLERVGMLLDAHMRKTLKNSGVTY